MKPLNLLLKIDMRDFLIDLLGGWTSEEYKALLGDKVKLKVDFERATNTVRELEAVVAKLTKPKRKYVRKA